MDGINENDKVDDVMLPGFRFHPTDEELVGFYLKRKIQQRPLPIELIKQVDIYKYDPWDLPNLASTGEKEWYFYCPRDRKYRNSARPNRVTGAGFWKATGTDRPIYSTDGTKCIGLKKSLVFYRGRAAKGLKTDWMMHEFRLPSSVPDAGTAKKFQDKNFPPNDSWAICRIFKKANTMAQRALSHSWASPLPESMASDLFTQGSHSGLLSSENMSCTTGAGSIIQLCTEMEQNSTSNFPSHNIPSYRPINTAIYKPSPLAIPNGDFHNSLAYSPPDFSGLSTKSSGDIDTMLFNLSPGFIGNGNKITDNINPQQEFDNLSMSSSEEMQGIEEINAGGPTKDLSAIHDNNQWRHIQPMAFPFSLPSVLPEEWKPNMAWDSPPCPSEVSPTYSTNKSST